MTSCRKRKTRCSGGATCELCIEHQVVCTYDEEPPPRNSTSSAVRRSVDEGHPHTPRLAELEKLEPRDTPTYTPRAEPVAVESGQPSRRPSLEPEATFDHGLHVGPTSGVAFLYRWQEDAGSTSEPTPNGELVPLTTYGDMSLPRVAKAQLPDAVEGKALMLVFLASVLCTEANVDSEHYFRFSMPTFRFFHQQTIERWMQNLIDRKPLEPIQAASVMVVWAHALMYSEKAPTAAYRISDRSVSYLQQVKALMNNEGGPAQVSSVEARLATCLVLLTISSFNECRFLFGLTHTLVITLGLHRKTPKQYKMSPLESQRRKRVFWAFYSIDGYLSVMLGQPRLLRDEDVDQEYPENIDDLVLDTATDLKQCPHHGSIEAALLHARLARLFAKANDILYPVEALSTVEIIQRSQRMVDALDNLERSFPPYLQPRISACLGTQTWDRQNSVLGLAMAHARILATRRTTLLTTSSDSLRVEDRQRHQTCLHACINAICAMIDRVHPMIQHKKLLWGFWLTQYVTTCAISTFLVFKMQSARGTVTYENPAINLHDYYERAEEIQKHLALIAPEGSQSKRHHQLLEKLQQRANRAHLKIRTTQQQNHQNARDVLPPIMASTDELLYSGADTYDALPPASTFDSGELTPNMFDYAFLDASSWQFLDQLGSVESDFNSDLWSYAPP